ncbi:MAG: electron transport complex subunit RsxB [Acidihalobacter sp.]|uniref:electron transport complex subunit RsxB n=1 Tax=Acidihalobacter sp. TaxID=1872108 RepID=UPI00307F3101
MPYLVALTLICLLGLALLSGYAFFARRRAAARPPLADRIDALLPQTQCGQCDYPGCRPYAEAIARNEADINQCPPGGDDGIRALARLLGRAPKPLNTRHGEHKEKAVARIDEDVCIGCTLCIQACPVDAILGAAKLMHTVIEDECTGCELCLPPCPVDCISMEPPSPEALHRPLFETRRRHERRKADKARQRYNARQRRLAEEQREREARMARKKQAAKAAVEDPRKAAIRAAIERTRAKKKQAATEATAQRHTPVAPDKG